MRTKQIALTIFSIAFLLGACGGSAPSLGSQLGGETWVLTAYNDTPPIAGTEVTLRFEEGQVSGNAGCNQYGGGYQIDGDAIRFDALFNTEMACLDPEGRMEQERVYLELLGSADRIALDGGVLTFFSGSQPILTFERE
jgi:heat shock protein HslJ